MLRTLMPAAALALPVALTLAMSVGHVGANGPDEPKAKQGIRAEVTGTLRFENGHGYYVSVKSAENMGRETRVWLRAAEDKALVRQLQELNAQEVTARGELVQLPQDIGANVPPMGIYLKHDFEIERAKAK